MLRWTVTFLIVAIIAAVFGFGGIAAGAASIAKILFFIFIVLFLLSLIYNMKKFFLFVSLFSAIAWVISFFILKAGPLIHALLFISLLSYLRSVIIENSTLNFKIWNSNKH